MNDPVTAARERLERLLPDVLRYDPVSMPAFDQRIDALIEAVRAEAGGVSVEALLDAWEAQEHPSIDAAIQAALAARSAGSGSLVERVRRRQASGGGPVSAVMVSRSPDAPEPSAALVEAREWLTDYVVAATLGQIDVTEVSRRLDRLLAAARAEGLDVGALAKALQVLVDEDSGGWHDWLAGEGTMGPAIEGLRVARKVAAAYQAALARPTPPPAVDGTRCAECGGVKDDVFHVPCLVGGPFHYVKTCHPFTPPTPDPDRLRALEAALDHAEKNLGVIALTLTDHPEYPMKAADVDAARSLARFTAQDIRAARALLADGERSDG